MICEVSMEVLALDRVPLISRPDLQTTWCHSGAPANTLVGTYIY